MNPKFAKPPEPTPWDTGTLVPMKTTTDALLEKYPFADAERLRQIEAEADFERRGEASQVTSIAIKLGFDPKAFMAIQRKTRMVLFPQKTKKKHGPSKGQGGRPNKLGLAKGLNARDHTEYVRQWRAKRKAKINL